MKKSKKFIVISLSLLVSVLCFIGVVQYSTSYVEHEYLLSEVDSDVYAIYHKTYSRVPAQNYDVVTLCCDNSVQTFTGDVAITFTDGDPYVMIQDYKYVNGDNIYVYVPKGSVLYENNVNIR